MWRHIPPAMVDCLEKKASSKQFLVSYDAEDSFKKTPGL